MTDVILSTVSPAYSAARSTADSGIPIVGAMGENIGRPGVCILKTGMIAPSGSLASTPLPAVDQPRRQLGAPDVATPPSGRGVGHHAMRGRPPETEQGHSKHFVGHQDPALVLGMRTRHIDSRLDADVHMAATHNRNVEPEPVKQVHKRKLNRPVEWSTISTGCDEMVPVATAKPPNAFD